MARPTLPHFRRSSACGLLFLGLVWQLAAGRAQVTQFLQSPSVPIPAGSTAVIVLFLANDGSSPATVDTPASIPLLAATPLRARAFALSRGDGEPERVTVPGGGFRRVKYVVDVPSGAQGLGVLAAEDPTFRFSM